MRKVSMGGRTSRVAAGVIAALVLSVFTFGGQAAAWSAPTLRAACAPDATHYAWTITLPSESNFKIDESWSSSFSGATTTDFGTAGAHSFTTARGGTKLYVRWTSDHGVTANATANSTPCGGTTNGAECTAGVATMTNHGALMGLTAGGTASVTFTMSNGCAGKELTLVSYTAPSGTFSADTASQQQVFGMQTGTFTNGSFTLSVAVPSCFFQIDFVTGKVIEHLGPAGSSNFYGSRLIAGANGGAACTTTTTTTTTTTSNTGTGTTTTGNTTQAVAGFQTPPSSAAVGAVTPIVVVPGGSNQLPPSTVQSVQTAPVVAVRGLPSTSTESTPTFPLAALGLGLIGIGGVLLRRRDTRI